MEQSKLSAHAKYLSYVIRHKWFVYQAGRLTGTSLWRLVKHDWSKFLPSEWFPYVAYFYGNNQRIVGSIVFINCIDGFSGRARITAVRRMEQSHYKVKMLPAEANSCVDPLEQEFWAHDFEVEGCDPRSAQAVFNRAWLLHQQRNDHHWQHWVLHEDDGGVMTLPMPRSVCREMVADWMGAGRAITGRWETAEWYAANKHKQIIDAGSRAFVESLIEEMRLKGRA